MTTRSTTRATTRSTTRSTTSSVGSGAVAGAAFVITPSTATPVAGVDVTWSTNAASLGTPVSYAWDFGDGTIPVTGATPSHYFVGLGPYTVTCVVTYDDNSTDTDTQVISPTAPAANSDLTLVEAVDFDAYMDNTSTGGWDETVSYIVAIYSVPVGAKPAVDAGVGTNGQSFSNWWLAWDIDDSHVTGVTTQLSGWFYFDQYPTLDAKLICLRLSNSTTPVGWAIKTNGDLTYYDYDLGPVVHTNIPLKTWFWVGFAVGPGDSAVYGRIDGTFLYKSAQGAVEVAFQGYAYNAWVECHLCAGILNYAGNQGGKTRASQFKFHTLASIADAGYPTDVVQPQDEHHIYQINPDTGNDANDGITAPWQTITKVRELFSDINVGIITNHTANVNGSGNYLVIDTSTAPFVVDDEPLLIYRNGTWLKPAPGESEIVFKAYGQPAPGDWSATGGYSDIYETVCTVPVQTTVFGDNVCFEPVADLAALDAAAGGASWVDTSVGKLHIKTLGLTNPTSDGITYIYGKQRPSYVGDPVGYSVVSVAAASCRISDCKIWYTAVNKNGSYAIGDWSGFSEGLLVERCSSKYSDKHGICMTIDANNSTIDIVDCYAGFCWNNAFTSFMASGSGNVHNYIRCITDVGFLKTRSALGEDVYVRGNGPGIFYCHGAGSAYDSVNFIDCDFNGSIESEYAPAVLVVEGGEVQFVRSYGPVNMDTVIVHDIVPINGTVTGLTVVTGNTYTTVWGMEGSLTNSTFDLRTLAAQAIGLWTLTEATTFTGNTIRFAAGQSSPIIKDSAAADIVAWNNNTYYIEAAAVFAKNFDAGGGAADYTFAQWQALGYDAASTRLDPT